MRQSSTDGGDGGGLPSPVVTKRRRVQIVAVHAEEVLAQLGRLDVARAGKGKLAGGGLRDGGERDGDGDKSLGDSLTQR